MRRTALVLRKNKGKGRGKGEGGERKAAGYSSSIVPNISSDFTINHLTYLIDFH
jgi:hypothetical protein